MRYVFVLLLVGFAVQVWRSSKRIRWMAGGGVLLLALFVFQWLNLPTDEAKIRQTVEIASTSGNPAHCDERLTQRYLRQLTGLQPPFADETCESEAAWPAADAVETSKVVVDGDRATAAVSYRGGSLDGSTLVLELVWEEGRWKLDRRVAVAHFDRAGFDRAYKANLVEFDTPPRAIKCALGETQRFSDSEIERAILNGSYRGSAEIIVACDRPGVERHLAKAVKDPTIGLPPKAMECAEDRIVASTDEELVRLQLDGRAYMKLLLDCDPNVLYDRLGRKLAAGDLGSETNECILKAFHDLSTDRAIHLIYDEDRYRALIETCKH